MLKQGSWGGNGFIALMVMVILGCGREGDSSSSSEEIDVNNQETLAIAKKKNLPACGKENQKQLVYVISDKQFYTCEDGWEKIDIGQETQEQFPAYSGLWKDPKTGTTWYINPLPVVRRSPCPSYLEPYTDLTFSFPSADEVREALDDGMFKDINVRIWVAGDYYIYSNAPDTVIDDLTTPYNEKAFSTCLVK